MTIYKYKLVQQATQVYDIYYRPCWLVPFYLIGIEVTLESADDFINKHKAKKNFPKKTYYR